MQMLAVHSAFVMNIFSKYLLEPLHFSMLPKIWQLEYILKNTPPKINLPSVVSNVNRISEHLIIAV